MQEKQETSTSNTNYDLISTLYHELQEEQTCAAYIRDAENEGKQDVASFFRNVQQDARKHCDQAKQLLGMSDR
ncbi:hypothetical protein [Ktedonospora formicarum]|uniref:Ferritin-like diiron domain-containing protein n=1 Tax=Ktedonospora formicarum TaxID=2778364 RepID=A0A8J3I1B7_9CHLR|nr:hypothetical protein [Ktedonospora formicarum]GHO45781.1 hypothetical protein KSX_39440 [Ktedonospora formicarum]